VRGELTPELPRALGVAMDDLFDPGEPVVVRAQAPDDEPGTAPGLRARIEPVAGGAPTTVALEPGPDGWSRRTLAGLPADSAPIVCVQVIYEPRAVPRLSRWLGRGDANSRLQAHLDKRAPVLEAGAAYPGVQAVRLRKLDDVRPVDLRTWQEMDPVRDFSRGADFTGEIDALFREPDARRDNGLPMNRVVPELNRWLRPFTEGV
jgi:hypothetical protein